jgi:TatD DNase family protein
MAQPGIADSGWRPGQRQPETKARIMEPTTCAKIGLFPGTMLIDTHCHLNDPSFADTLPEVIERAEAAGVLKFVVPAYDKQSLQRTADLAALYPTKIHPAFGIHPWFLSEPFTECDLRPFLESPRAVAVGEIGLDFSSDTGPEEPQLAALTLQLGLARELNLPVLIHCRKAYDRLYQVLRSFAADTKGVLHSFSGSTEMMMRFLDLGFYVSFSGSVTRRTARKYHKNAAAVPLERLLLETDAPSIATETTVASKVEPLHTREVAEKIAEIRGFPVEEICQRSTANALRLFSLE